eukprot:snap_masked-scaffold_19-processed-gene-0.5-mRNA-1 protein AED:1.00 eAED:1.00 QI:0/-1/0/0/-1/1/1/0/328
MSIVIAVVKFLHRILKAYYELRSKLGLSSGKSTPGHLALQKLFSLIPSSTTNLKLWREAVKLPIFNNIMKTSPPSGYSNKELKITPSQIPLLAIRNEKKQNKKAIFFIHGGGYIAGGYEGYISMLNRLSNKLGFDVYAPNYRLSPETSFAELKSDCIETLKYVKEEFGYEYSDIYLCGDSAGGGLVFYVLNYMLEHLEHFKTLPEKAVLISPYIDIGNVERDISKVNDPMISVEALKTFQEATECTGLITDDLEGKKKAIQDSKCLITASREELIFGDGILTEKMLKNKGFEVKTSFSEFGLHDYPLLYLYDETYEESFREIEDFFAQ